MSILKAAVATVLLLTAVPAHADWQATRWGMSETEAAAAVPGSAPADPTDVQSYSNAEGKVGLLAPYRTSEFGFRVFLRFAPNGQGLSSVLLLLDDAKDKGLRLRDALTDRYGEPQLRPLAAYTVLVVRCQRMLPIRCVNRTTSLSTWWSDSPDAWEASVRIRPLGWETERDIIRLTRMRDDFWSLTYVDKALPPPRSQQGPPKSDGL